MSVLKTFGIVGAISGIGLIGYYLFNKYKPTIAQQQIDEIEGDLYIPIDDKPEYRKIWTNIAKYGVDNIDKGQVQNRYIPLLNQIKTQTPLVITGFQKSLLDNALSNISDKGIYEKILGITTYQYDPSAFSFQKKSKGLADELFSTDKYGRGLAYTTNCEYNPSKGEKNPCAYNFTAFPSYVPKIGSTYQLISANQSNFDNYFKYAPNEYIGYFRELPNPSGEDIRVSAENCVELDRDMKKLIDRIAEQTKSNPNSNLTAVLQWYKAILEDYFSLHSCRDKIEKQRLLDIAKTETLSSISQEKSVLGAGQKNQNIYLGVGALVLVLSAGILVSSGGSSTPTTSGASSSGGILGNIVIFGGLTGMGYLIFKKPKVVLPKT